MRERSPAIVLMSLVVVLATAGHGSSAPQATPTADGYRGIWYGLRAYGGGFAVFPSQHSPFAIYRSEAKKTFFVYGGTVAGKRQLQAMASYYDHERGVVPRPTIVHDWGEWNLKSGPAADAHRNPTISVDGDGRVWVFVSGHGDNGYVYRAKEPYSVESFELVVATPMTYPNAWWIPNKGFFLFFTKYDHSRESFWLTSPDGKSLADSETWKTPGQLNAWTVSPDGDKPGHGNYQFTAAQGSRVATAMNHWIGRTRDRSSLFYLQSDDMGKTWQTADGKPFTPPIRQVKCPPLVRDFWGGHLQVYVQHLTFDRQGRPAILFLTSPLGQGAEGTGGPKTGTIAHWVGDRWAFHQTTALANNFDCGSLSIEDDGTWRIIGPTEARPQALKTGGEIAMWTSNDEGKTWKKVQQLTQGSKYNHSYVRQPVDAHPDFYGLWADGDGDKPSSSRLYFCSKAGDVRVLPATMSGNFAKPETLERKSETGKSLLVPTVLRGNEPSATLRVAPADAERRKTRVPTRSVGTRY